MDTNERLLHVVEELLQTRDDVRAAQALKRRVPSIAVNREYAEPAPARRGRSRRAPEILS